LNPTLDPRPKIIYQAIIPNDSEIFRVVAHGSLRELFDILEGRDERITGRSLSDRDEAGRPLLSVK
jgi:hypothetical protein